MRQYAWEPGNGTSYNLVYGPLGSKLFLAWMRRGGSGGTCIVWDAFLTHEYLEEKLNINTADANGILLFLEKMGHQVGLPTGDDFEKCYGTSALVDLTKNPENTQLTLV
jgi:hypothetical protein